MPSSGIVGLYGSFISSLLRISILSSIVVYIYLHFTFNLHSHKQCKRVLSFPHPLSAFIVCKFFDNGYSEQCEMISHCSFDLHFSNPGQF